jgi:hypothetical protein
MSLCRYFRSDGFARGAKAAALFSFGTPGLSGMCDFETTKIRAGKLFRRPNEATAFCRLRKEIGEDERCVELIEPAASKAGSDG